MVGAGPHMDEPYFFWKQIGPIEPLIWGKICPWNWFLGFHSAIMVFFRKKFQSRILYPISHRRGYIHFSCPMPHSLKNCHAPQKLFFAVILKNIVFFEKNVKQKLFKTSFFTNNFILIFVTRYPLSLQNGHVLPQMVFRSFFNVNWRTSVRFSYSKIYSFERKFYEE